MALDAVLLARLQFALTIGFHFLFPPTTIGLAWLLVYVEWRGWRRNDATYVRLGRFFSKVLALTFGMGVVTGVVMEFQFGMNWAPYAEFVGDVFGASLAAEGMLAFFLESAFLGLYLFGRQRLAPWAHWISCLMVAVGATLSAFWILAANSWQQTPAGHTLVARLADGTERAFAGVTRLSELPAGAVPLRAELVDFWAAVFSPSALARLLHQVNACLVVGAFLMAGVGAYLLRRGRDEAVARTAVRVGVVVGVVSALVLLFGTGGYHGRLLAVHQPAKLAACEGLTTTQRRAPLLVFGVPVPDGERWRIAAQLGIPGLLSFLAKDDVDAEIEGLTAFAPADLPNVPLVFTAFHLMVGLGLVFIGLGLLAALGLWRGTLWRQRWLQWALVANIPLPLLANELGWIVAEVGRQPWVVYHLLRTSAAVSPTVRPAEILASLLVFGTVYLLLGALYVGLLVRLVRRGPATAAGPAPSGGG